jgi:hypothetical protein
MIKLIDILNEARITPVGMGNELTYYVTGTDEDEEIFFQTKRGIEIMKKILDDTHPNNTDTYAWIDDEEDIKEIIDHPLYKLFVNEAYKASSILQPFINKLPYGVKSFLGNNMVDVNGNDDSKLIVGPSISYGYAWDDEEIEIYEEIINILSNQGIKFINEKEIFLALIGY